MATLRPHRCRWRSIVPSATVACRAGQHVLLQGVGGGFTWGSVLVRF
jgi:hypothetical protein